MYPMKKPLTTAIALSLMCLCGSRAMGQGTPGAITVTEGEVTMPTYEHAGRELQPPLFADSAVTGVYPFPTYKMPLSAKPVERKYKAIFVESDSLKLTYLPELGGRFMALYDKLNKRNVFYKNDVLKPTQFNARMDWPQEGIELTGPFDIHSLTLKYDPYWSNTVLKRADGSVTVMLGEVDPFYGMKVTLAATLHPGVHGLEISVFCFNPNTSRMPQMFWTNAAFPLTQQTQFLYPMSRTVGHNTGEVTDWPLYQGVDYSWDRNNKNMLGVFGIDLYDNFGGAYMYDQDYGVFRYADRRVVQGMKMWTWGHGRDAEATERSYTDKAGPYYEAQSGRHVWDGHYEWVAPHQVERWSEWWIPVAGTKGLSTVTDAAALNLRAEGSSFQIDLSPVRSVPAAVLTVASSTGVLAKETLALTSGKTIHRSISAKGKAESQRDVTVTLTDGSGAVLLQYHRPDGAKSPSEYTAFTRELEKPTKLPEQMSPEELVLAAEFRLKELDDAGAMNLLDISLKRDPGYSEANTLKGIVLYKQGKLAAAETALQSAVDRNPYADRAWYHLAVTQIDRGNRSAAERNLYYIWPDSAYFGNREYQLGRLNLLRGDTESAIEHLRGAVAHNADDLSAHHMLAIAYRISKHNDLSEAECAALLRIDPTDRAAFAERYLRTHDASAKAELERRMGNQTQEALHVAEFYSAAERWGDAADLLRLEEAGNDDPFGTSAVYYYTLADDLSHSGDSSGAKAAREKAKRTADVVDRFPYLPSSEAPLRAAIAADPKDELAHFDLGCLLYYLGRHDEAVAQWSVAEQLNGKDFKVERVLALAAAESGSSDPAIVHLQRAVKLQPDHLGTVNDLVSQFARAGRFDDELKLLKDSIARSTDQDDLLIRLLQVQLVQGRYSEADEVIAKHTFSPRHRDTQLRDTYRSLKYAEAGQAFTAGRYANSLELLQAVANPPATLGVDDFQFEATARLRFYLGRTYEALGKQEEARKEYEQSVSAVDLTAGDHASYSSDNVFMLLALDRLGRKAEADVIAPRFIDFANSQTALKRSHRRSEGHYLLGLLALRAGDATKAKLELEEALRIEPDFLAPRFDLRAETVGINLAKK
jgi:tetratricopeptide (TPR) repeat protein